MTWEEKIVSSVDLMKIGLIRTLDGKRSLSSTSKRSTCFTLQISISSIRLILINPRMWKCGPSFITSRTKIKKVKFMKSSNQSLRETVWTSLQAMSCSMSFIKNWTDKQERKENLSNRLNLMKSLGGPSTSWSRQEKGRKLWCTTSSFSFKKKCASTLKPKTNSP